MDSSRKILREQAGIICGRLGHDMKIALPVQTRDATYEVLCGCATCGKREWIALSRDAYEQLLEDAATGKIK